MALASKREDLASLVILFTFFPETLDLGVIQLQPTAETSGIFGY